MLEPIKNKLAPASYIFSKIEIKKFKKRILRLSTYSNLHATCPPIEPWPKVYKNFFYLEPELIIVYYLTFICPVQVSERGRHLLESGLWSDCEFTVGLPPNIKVGQYDRPLLF